jgi:predicted O-methyltransferase YrrM
VPLYTAETDPDRARAAAELFADDPDVHVLPGDWRETLPPQAPFDLLFVDAKPKEDPEPFLGLVVPGGTIVVDDLTPGRSPDPLRDAWLGHRGLLAVELAVSPVEAVIVAVTRR